MLLIYYEKSPIIIEVISLMVYNYEILLPFHELDMLEYICKHVAIALFKFDDVSASLTILELPGQYSMLPILLAFLALA